jgi:hypothetical protein
VLYLLDADTLIRADRTYYPLQRFPVFWQWLLYQVIERGYASDLDETELITVGKDPFLIAYGLVSTADRTIVSFEVSAPAKKRANRKIPDVCAGFGLNCITMFELIKTLDFTTNWTPPK